MKTHSYSEYSRLFNPAYSKHMRGIPDRLGLVLTVELSLLVFTLIMMKCGKSGGGYWGAMPAAIISALVSEGKIYTYGLFRTDDRKNLFYRTIPGRRSILKKAVINSEINRFLCVAVFSAGSEMSMVMDGKPFRPCNAVFQMMILYMAVSLFMYFFRLAKTWGIVLSAIAGLISVIVMILVINVEITPVGASVISVSGIAFSVFLNYLLLRKIAGAGRKAP